MCVCMGLRELHYLSIFRSITDPKEDMLVIEIW